MSEFDEADTCFYEGYRIEVDWDSVTQRCIASARKEGTRSIHATGITERYAIEAVEKKIRTELKQLKDLGS